jgi:hypothetical protein
VGSNALGVGLGWWCTRLKERKLDDRIKHINHVLDIFSGHTHKPSFPRATIIGFSDAVDIIPKGKRGKLMCVCARVDMYT